MKIAGTGASVPDAGEEYQRAYKREKKARRQAEITLENRARDLYESNLKLKQANIELTESRQYLLRNERLTTLATLYASLAHEINNPLAYMMSNVELLLEDAAWIEELVGSLTTIDLPHSEALSETNPDLLEKIQRLQGLELASLLSDTFDGLKRIKRQVEEFRKFSNLSDNERGEVDLGVLISDTVQMMLRHLPMQNRIIIEITEPLWVFCNGNEIRQVLINLINNAVQALTADDQRIFIRIWQENGAACLSVLDQGKGVSEEAMGHLFKPFVTTKSSEQGTGLGLYIAKGILDNHGVKLEVTSEIDKGTCFILRFSEYGLITP